MLLLHLHETSIFYNVYNSWRNYLAASTRLQHLDSFSHLNVVGEVGGLTVDQEVDLEPVVAPAGKLHHAGLLVKGKVLDVDEAGGLEDGRAEPGDVAVRGDNHVCAQRP